MGQIRSEIPTEIEELPTKEINFGQTFKINTSNVTYLTHKIHKYPAKFIPQIPSWAINRHLNGKRERILDPFCGSGTTLVEAILAGKESYGIDIDPLARMISRVKTTPIDPEILSETVERLVQQIKNETSDPEFVPELATLSHWFTADAIHKLGIIRDKIEHYRDNASIYEFLVVTFSSIIRRVSNADNQSQKTYVSHTNPKHPEDAYKLFFKHLETYKERIISLTQKLPNEHSSQVLEDCLDARNFADYWKKNSSNPVDLAITSPPYIKSVNYIYTHMAEYFWIGDLFGLQTQKLQNKWDKKYIGTKRVYIHQYENKPKTQYEGINEYIDKVYSKNPKHGFILGKYFLDMEKNIQQMYKVLKDQGHYVIVIGNSNVSGFQIPSSEFLIEIAEKNGFYCDLKFGYVIRNRYMRFPRKGRGGLIKYDWVLDFQKE